MTADDHARAFARDPVRFVHRYASTEDREVVALLAALLAFGNVATIGAKVEVLLGLLGPSPGRAARRWTRARLHTRLDGFVHRTFRGEDIADLLAGAGAVMRAEGSLYAPLVAAYARTPDLRSALVSWSSRLRAEAWPQGVPSRAAAHLLPDPSGASACKRLVLLCRWLVRRDDVDPGLLPDGAIPPSALLVPLDVHVHRFARAFGLTHCRSASWRAAEEVTAHLRGVDPHDPVRFDFVLCHDGITASRAARLRDAPAGPTLARPS